MGTEGGRGALTNETVSCAYRRWTTLTMLVTSCPNRNIQQPSTSRPLIFCVPALCCAQSTHYCYSTQYHGYTTTIHKFRRPVPTTTTINSIVSVSSTKEELAWLLLVMENKNRKQNRHLHKKNIIIVKKNVLGACLFLSCLSFSRIKNSHAYLVPPTLRYINTVIL